jgi:glutathione peroxidase
MRGPHGGEIRVWSWLRMAGRSRPPRRESPKAVRGMAGACRDRRGGAPNVARSDMSAGETETGDAYQFEFAALGGGGTLPLAAWRGRPVLVVNTASFCGYTPQYRDLEAAWQKYRDRGLVVLGVPSNDFGQQEPGTAAEIKQFCETNYAVDFPLTEKIHVIGAAAHPFYRWVAQTLGEGAAPRWNFHKYLIGPDGQLAGTWPSQVKPGDNPIAGEIERLLPSP